MLMEKNMHVELIQNNKLNEENVIILPVTLKDINLAYKLVDGLEKSLKAQNYNADKGSIIVFNSLGNFKRVVLLGLGEDISLYKNNYSAMDLGGKLASVLNKFDTEVSIVLSHLQDSELVRSLGLCLICGLRLKTYKFRKYFTNKKTELYDLDTLSKVKLVTNGLDLSKEINYGKALVGGIIFTRSLVSEPSNKLNSLTFANKLQNLTKLGLEIEVLNQDKLENLKMGSLLSVNQASANEAKVVILKWYGADDAKPVAFVGKGVTFDSGGLSLKPAGAMVGMNGDMAGAATVCGLMKTLALRKAKVNAIGVIGLVENMVCSNATRPGDVVTSYSGKTIEILNTDAEGRLVLADILYYTQEMYKPEFMIDLATLTGAIIIALGYKRAGLFSNSPDLEKQLIESGNISGDKLWSLPVTEEYRPMLNSNIADIANIANIDRAAGSVTAAVFLKDFIKDAKWAHIDIAGVAWDPEASDINSKGASGFGVRLLDTLIANYYEKK